MSFYAAQVGEVIIKPQNRQDFGRFFCEDYEKIEDKALLGFVENWITDRNVFFTPPVGGSITTPRKNGKASMQPHTMHRQGGSSTACATALNPNVWQ